MPATVYAVLVDLPVELGADEVDASVVTESSPLCVNQHVLLLWLCVIIEEFRVLHLFYVACVASGTWWWSGLVVSLNEFSGGGLGNLHDIHRIM